MIHLFHSDVSDENVRNKLEAFSKTELIEFVIQLRNFQNNNAIQAAIKAELQDLFVEILDTFIDVSLDELDNKLNQSLKKLGTFFGADRIFIFDISPKTDLATMTFEWCAEGVKSNIGFIKNIPIRIFPDWYHAHAQGQIFYVSNIDELDGGNPLKRSFAKEGIKSIFSVPLMNDGKLIGLVGLDFIRQFNPDPAVQERLLSLFAKMLVNLKNRLFAISKIKSRERFLSDLIENSGSVTYVKRMDGTYVRVNKTWEEVTGHPREKVIGNTDFDLFEEAIAQQFRQNDLEVIQGNKKMVVEEILLVNHVLKHFISVKFPTYSSNGQVNGMAGISTEITELKKTELYLREHEAHLNAILNSSLESIWSINRNYEITFVNDIVYDDFLRAFGKELNKGSNIIDLLPDIIKDYWRDKYDQVFTGAILDFNEKVQGESELFYLNIRMYPVIVDDKVVGAAVFSRNLTQQMIAIEQRDAHFATIEKQNHILREIAWMQSHLVRAPLARMLGLIKLLSENDGNEQLIEIPKIIKHIEDSANELDTIIHQISEKTYLSDQLEANKVQQN
jgi:PAS domain S-box-containing protein